MTTRRPVSFVVYGIAQPKGSTKAFMPKGARFPVVTSDNTKLKPWATDIQAAIQQAAIRGLFEGPVAVTLEFYLPRPKSLPKAVTAHTRKPDLDKLVRGVLDACTGKLWRDDAQVTSLTASKRYAHAQPQVRVFVETDAAQPVIGPVDSPEALAAFGRGMSFNPDGRF